MLLTNKRQLNRQCLMKVEDATVQTKKVIKYLAMMLDTKFTFGP